MEPRAVQAALQGLFAQWGLPERIRVDNGFPWGNASDLPPPLALWWVGVGIGVIWNHAYRPTENAKVERAHGTLHRWSEPARCATFAAWEQALAREARVQREQYQSVGGQSRWAAYPQLQARARPYAAEQEAQQWDLARVWAYLAPGMWPRQVSQRGQISLYGKAYQVGAPHGGEPVWVRLEAATGEWVVQDRAGQELARHRADQLTADRIRQLQVAKPHASSKRPRRRANLPPPPATILYAA